MPEACTVLKHTGCTGCNHARTNKLREKQADLPVRKAGIELEVMAFLHAFTAAEVMSCLHKESDFDYIFFGRTPEAAMPQ
jgi:hypothetical protein